jgi:hypothetical protein
MAASWAIITRSDWLFSRMELSLARIVSAFVMNKIQRGRVTCYMDEIQLLRSFGERQRQVDEWISPEVALIAHRCWPLFKPFRDAFKSMHQKNLLKKLS